MILLLAALFASAPPASSRGRIAVTLSGGVSLGSYEAGLTWAFVRSLRASPVRSDLAAVTGASAGAINALLAAASWCREEADTRDENPDANMFHDLWAPVGLDDLLPDEPSAFAPADAILSAAPLERAFRRVREEVLAPSLRFRPGCAVSVGLTVTRERPEERTVAGLRAPRQRFVIPWRFEVDEAGRARIVSAPFGAALESADAQLLLAEPRGVSGIGAPQASQAALASGAFPFAFRPRQLCDCALRCPDANVVQDASCEGPEPRQTIGGLSCYAIPPVGSRKLCGHLYVDGGIFDNAPIGLAVDLAEASGAPALPFNPTLYAFVDPDHRRLAPVTQPAAMRGLTASVGLLPDLIGTARESELARAIRDERWQRTTQSTLSDLAQLQADVAAIQEEMARAAGASDTVLTGPAGHLLRSPRREALASFLRRCLDDIHRAVERGRDPAGEQFADCAGPLRNGTAGEGMRGARPTAADVVRLASTLATVFATSAKTAQQIVDEMSDPRTPFDRQLRLLAITYDVSTIAIASYRFLAGEVPGIAASDLDQEELVRLRRDLLAVAGSGSRLLRGTSAALRVLLVATLLEEEMEGRLAPKAASARAAIAARGDPDFESPVVREMAAASERVARLVALAPRLRTLTDRATAIAASAAQLSSMNAPERRLVLSRRFSPLGGGSLLNFSGFLDRPLRDLDFHSGVYDAVVQLATYECELQGPYPAGSRPAPVFRAEAPLVLDPSAEDTQRCIGQAMRAAVEMLALRRSPRATFVLAKLARLELAAQLGDPSAAERLLREPSWSWLGDPTLPAGDQLPAALAAVTSRTGPCREGATVSLCLRDPTFDELLDGLQAAGYVASSPSMRDALADRDRWTASIAARLLDRAAAVEVASSQRARREPSELVLRGVALGEVWARKTQRQSGPLVLDLDPSSIPERSPGGVRPGLIVAAHVFPYRVSLDFVRGGAAFSWVEPALHVTSWFSLESIADLLAIDGSGRLRSSLGLLPTAHVRGVAVGAGFESRFPWNGDRVPAPGAIGRIAFVQERLAVSVGVRSLSAGQREVSASVSLSDLNGLVYWLALWAAGPK